MKTILAIFLALFFTTANAQVADDLIVGDCVLVNQEDPTLAFWWTRCLGPWPYKFLSGYDPGVNRAFAYQLGATGEALIGTQTPSAALAAIGGFSLPVGGTAAQYVRGDGTLATFPTAVSAFTNDAGYVTGSTTALVNYTTSAGLTALLSGKSNVPTGSTTQYLRGDGSMATFPTALSSFSNDTGFVTASTSALINYTPTTTLSTLLAGKFANPTGSVAQYVRGDGSIAGFPTVISTFTNDAGYVTSSTAALTNYTTTATLNTQLASKFNTPAGTSTQCVRGDGSVGQCPSSTRTFTTASRSLNTAFQVSTTQDAFVSYNVDINVTSPLLAGAQGTVTLQYADNSGMTTNLATVNAGTNATSGVLNLANTGTVTLSAMIPANKWVRIVSTNVTGTPTFTYRTGQEVLM